MIQTTPFIMLTINDNCITAASRILPGNHSDDTRLQNLTEFTHTSNQIS